MKRIGLLIAVITISLLSYGQENSDRVRAKGNAPGKETTTRLYTTKLVTLEVKRRNVIETRKVLMKVPVGTKGVRLQGPAAKNRRFAH